MRDLNGAIALITGGGRGLGEALCRTLGKAGVMVVSADIREELAQQVALAITADGGKAIAMRLDVTDEAQVQTTIDQIVAEYGHLDILINNAGIAGACAPAEQLLSSDWDRIMAVNLRGPFLMSKYALALMKQRQSGHIVNIVSTAAKRAWANTADYHASKWGLLGLSYALHVEARTYNVKVTAIVSGGMRTPFLLERFPDIDPAVLQDPQIVADTIRFVLTQPPESVIPEVTVLSMNETYWP